MLVWENMAGFEGRWENLLGELLRDRRFSGIGFLAPTSELQAAAAAASATAAAASATESPVLFASGCLAGLPPADCSVFGRIFEEWGAADAVSASGFGGAGVAAAAAAAAAATTAETSAETSAAGGGEAAADATDGGVVGVVGGVGGSDRGGTLTCVLKGRLFQAVRRTACTVVFTSPGRRFELVAANLPVGVLLAVFGLPDLPQQMVPVVDAFAARLRA